MKSFIYPPIRYLKPLLNVYLSPSLSLSVALQVNPNSIASKNGRIREGDRILQVQLLLLYLTKV